MFSDLIYSLEDWLKVKGALVEYYAEPMKEKQWGFCDYKNSQITITTNVCTARSCLLTLLHEAGHWVFYLRNKGCYCEREYREKFAYLIGWTLNVRLCNSIFNKAEWREFHEDTIAGVA